MARHLPAARNAASGRAWRPQHETPHAALIVAALCAIAVAFLSFAAGYATAQHTPTLCDAGAWTDATRPGEYPVLSQTCHDGRIVLELD